MDKMYEHFGPFAALVVILAFIPCLFVGVILGALSGLQYWWSQSFGDQDV